MSLITTAYREGSPDAPILLLGEAPSYQEMKAGRPFVGPAGSVLSECLHSAGIVRNSCYILNLWEVPVVRLDEGNLIVLKEGGVILSAKKGLTQAGRDLAAPAIKRLQESKANVIAPLGGVALDLLFGDQRITKWRGSILPAKYAVPGRKFVATIHPAATLRGKYIWRYPIISDLTRIKEEATTPYINTPDRDLIIDPSFDQVLMFLQDCRQAKRVALDIEVLNHQVSCLAFALTPYVCMCIPFLGRMGEHRWTVEQETEIWLGVSAVLNDPRIIKINQNIIFDVTMLRDANKIKTQGRLEDPMIAHHIMWPDFPKGLDFITSTCTREPYYKDDGKLWSKPWQDIEAFWLYNAKDAAVAMEAWDVLNPMLDDGYRETYDQTIELLPALGYMMSRGIQVDRRRLEETKVQITAQIAEKRRILYETVGYELNPASPKQCQQHFYVKKGIKAYIGASGRPTTDDKAMSRIFRRHGLPEAKLIQEIRALEKLFGTYMDSGIDPDDRVRCSYNPRGTVTGRISSSQTVRQTGLNLQNLHPAFKGFLVADNTGLV